MTKLTQDEEALFDAVIDNEIEQVKELLAKGVNVNVKNKRKETPLHWASGIGYVDIAKALIEAKADVDAMDDWGHTPLHWANFKDHVDMAKVLLEAGADVNAKDDFDNTPLDYTDIPEMKELLQPWRAND